MKYIKKIISLVITIIMFFLSIPICEVKGNVDNDSGGLISRGISEAGKDFVWEVFRWYNY